MSMEFQKASRCLCWCETGWGIYVFGPGPSAKCFILAEGSCSYLEVSNPWGYPQIIHFNRSFHEINHPAIGVPPWLRNHPEVLADLPPCASKTHPWPRLGWVPGQWTATPWSKGVETPLRCSNDSEVTVKSVKVLRPNSAQLITYHNLSNLYCIFLYQNAMFFLYNLCRR